MNKKGFTTVELVLTLVLVAIIMATITNVTFTYRDRSKYEETKSEIIGYKNTVTKIIYDDILNKTNPVVSVTKISNSNYKLITSNNVEKNLIIINQNRKIGINYDGIEYIVPDSNDDLIEFEGVVYKEDTINNLYSLEIMFSHRNLENVYKIRIIIS